MSLLSSTSKRIKRDSGTTDCKWAGQRSEACLAIIKANSAHISMNFRKWAASQYTVIETKLIPDLKRNGFSSIVFLKAFRNMLYPQPNEPDILLQTMSAEMSDNAIKRFFRIMETHGALSGILTVDTYFERDWEANDWPSIRCMMLQKIDDVAVNLHEAVQSVEASIILAGYNQILPMDRAMLNIQDDPTSAMDQLRHVLEEMPRAFVIKMLVKFKQLDGLTQIQAVDDYISKVYRKYDY